jgi:hypothetical protein
MNREPFPEAASRGDALGQLQRERWLAQDAGETERVRDLDAKIQRLSAAGTPTAPTRETAASTAPRETAARTNPKPGPKPGAKPTKRNNRVSAR